MSAELITPVEFHEFANIYRMLPESELQKLAENIKAKGQLLPITSYEGKILDGRNRFKACEIAGVNPRIEEYTGDDPLGLVASLNDHRRHDTENERAMVGARMANLRVGVNQHTPMGAPSTPAVSIDPAPEVPESLVADLVKPLKLEVGKRYVRRDGGISGIIETRPKHYVSYPFQDLDSLITYTGDGKFYSYCGDDRDLISEYIEPAAEPAAAQYVEPIKTLRDEFAMAALKATIASPHRKPLTPSDDKPLANNCYAIADAMLAAREEGA